MDLGVNAELKALRKRLYLYHNELLEIERQSKICKDAYEEISKKRKYSEDEDQEDIDAFIFSHMPLQNEYILEMIANHLTNQDLKNCREVCRLWAKEMGRCLSARKALVVTEDDCPEANEVLMQYKRKDVVCISNLCFFDVPCTSRLYRRLLATFGWTLSGLKLEECKISPNELAEVLIRKAPNLESFSYKDRAPTVGEEISTFFKIQTSSLNVNNTDFCLPQLKRLHWDEEFGRVKLDEIIKLAPNLIELVYKNTPVPHPPDFHKIRWNTLKTLKISPRDELREEHFDSLASLKLKLRRLSMSGVNPKLKTRMQTLRKFLQTIAPTLEELELFQHYSIEMMPYNSKYESPFPVRLPVLKRLNLDFCILRSLKAVSSLPQLKTMECKSKNYLDWQIVVKTGVPKKHKTLTHLNLGSIDTNVLLKFSRSFQMITNLEVDAAKIDDEALRIIITGFPQLQQFKLSKIPLCSNLQLTDSGITGLSKEMCHKLKNKKTSLMKLDVSSQKKFPGIQDLKELYRLELTADESPLTDISLVYGITNCSKLLILGLPRCKITDASLKAIEQRLPALTMLELPMCPNVSEQGITTLKSNRKDLIFQCCLGVYGKLTDLFR